MHRASRSTRHIAVAAPPRTGSTSSSTSTTKAPIVRWLESWNTSTEPTPTLSISSESGESSSSGLSLLNEALNDELPRRPAPVHRMPSTWSSRPLSRPPPFMDNLTRSTLPVSSGTYDDPFENSASHHSPTSTTRYSPTAVRSLPARTSIDSLRNIHSTATNNLTPTPTPNRWWFQSENKEEVETLLNEEDRGETPEDIQKNIRKKCKSLLRPLLFSTNHALLLDHAPRSPIVFCHGLLGFDSVSIGPAIAPVQVTHWRGIKEVLEANGAEVLITRVPATSSPAERARVLEEKISQALPGRSVHLIGHSMGGLDCRYMTTHLTDRKFKVLSITTIATPHRGSVFADHFLSTIGATRMPSFVSLLDMLPNGGGDGSAFSSLTIDAMKSFNETTPDVPGVQYASWGATYEPGLIDTWAWPHKVVLEKEGPNDGLVSVASSKWGTYMGTVEHVNHLDLVGWINPARYKWAELTGKEIQFRPATFYLGVADWLAVKVEGQGEGTEAELTSDTGDTKAGEGVELREGDSAEANQNKEGEVEEGKLGASSTKSEEPSSCADDDETPTASGKQTPRENTPIGALP